jgi:hypothetical protein
LPNAVVWRTLAPRLGRVSLGVVAGAMVVSAAVWALDRADQRAARRVWGAGLTEWVARLDASNAPLRDSAIVAVSELASRTWDALADGAPPDAPTNQRAADSVLAAVRALTRRLGDPDSVLREHAVTAVLDVAERRLDSGTQVLVRVDTARLRPIRAVVRNAAGEMLRAADARRRGAQLAVLEVLATLGAPRDVAPPVAEVATRDSSPAVRALAAAVALPALARAGDAERHTALLRATLGDPSAEVRVAAVDALLHDAVSLCRDPTLRRQFETLRRDGDAVVRSAAALVPDAVRDPACRSAGQ